MVPSPPSRTDATAQQRLPPSLTDRLRLVAGAVAAGLAVGALAVVVGTVVAGVRPAADTGFLLGTLAFGFGLLGWAGSAFAGRGIETMQAHLDTSSGWTEEKSRRAMARVGGFGAGVMLAAVVVGTAFGYT